MESLEVSIARIISNDSDLESYEAMRLALQIVELLKEREVANAAKIGRKGGSTQTEAKAAAARANGAKGGRPSNKSK